MSIIDDADNRWITSFPFSKSTNAANTTLYVIFNAIDRFSLTSIYLECKQDLPYDWNGMKLLLVFVVFSLCVGKYNASYECKKKIKTGIT